MVNKYVRGTFTGTTTATIGAAFMKKDVILNGYRIVLQIWDTAGQERFRSMAPMYYRGAHAAILVFDVTQQDTLDKVGGWVEELQDNAGEDIILVMAANKCDLLQSTQGGVSMKEATEYAKSIGAALFETSAVNGKGIEALFAHVTQHLVKSEHIKEKQREQLALRKKQIRLDSPHDDDDQPKSSCSCS